jgi:hypothetical protein
MRLSPFERFCWAWYAENVGPFAMRAGIVADSFRETVRECGLAGAVKGMFQRALEAIDLAYQHIQSEMVKARRKEAEA